MWIVNSCFSPSIREIHSWHFRVHSYCESGMIYPGDRRIHSQHFLVENRHSASMKSMRFDYLRAEHGVATSLIKSSNSLESDYLCGSLFLFFSLAGILRGTNIKLEHKSLTNGWILILTSIVMGIRIGHILSATCIHGWVAMWGFDIINAS